MKRISGRARIGLLNPNIIVVDDAPGSKFDLCIVEPRIGKTLEMDQDNVIARVKHIINCWNSCEGINPEVVPELLTELKLSVEALAVTRDAITNLIKDKPTKWQEYVNLTQGMRIPQINLLLEKATKQEGKASQRMQLVSQEYINLVNEMLLNSQPNEEGDWVIPVETMERVVGRHHEEIKPVDWPEHMQRLIIGVEKLTKETNNGSE